MTCVLGHSARIAAEAGFKSRRSGSSICNLTYFSMMSPGPTVASFHATATTLTLI